MKKEIKEKKPEQSVIATVALRSESGKPLFDKKNLIIKNFAKLLPPSDAIKTVTSIFNEMGIRVTARGKFSLSIIASPKKFEETFGVKLIQKEKPVFSGTKKPVTRYYTTKTVIKVPKELADYVEAIILPEPCQLFQSATPPVVGYHHLDLPNDVASLVGASSCHENFTTGEGVKVVMVDSGLYNHPYFADKNYNINPTLSVYSSWDTNLDRVGHGTAMAANLLAVAPKVDFTMIKYVSDSYGGGISGMFGEAGFLMAKELNPDVISCSWGRYSQPSSEVEYIPLIYEEAEIWDAINNGIVVVFATGNKGNVCWQSCIPDVISVGGAYPPHLLKAHPSEGNWFASNYASSGNCLWRHKNRDVPDLCGITGPDQIKDETDSAHRLPGGAFIVSPTDPRSWNDIPRVGEVVVTLEEAVTDYNPDETGYMDGWWVISGTSSATTHVAGAAALVIQRLKGSTDKFLTAKGSRRVALIKNVLMETAWDIKKGQSANGWTARDGKDKATGAGLVNAEAACNRMGEAERLLKIDPKQFLFYEYENNI